MDEMFLEVDAATPASLYATLEQRLRAFLVQRPDEYDAKHSTVRAVALEQQSLVRLRVVVAHRTNWQHGELFQRRHDCIVQLKVLCDELGIAQPPAPLVLSPSPQAPVAPASLRYAK